MRNTGNKKTRSSRHTRKKYDSALRLIFVPVIILTTSQQSSGNKKAEDDANKETDEKLEEIKSIGGEKGPDIVDQLLKAVTDVKPVNPRKEQQE